MPLRSLRPFTLRLDGMRWAAVLGVLAALLIGALTPGDAPLRGEAPAAALPPLLATLADEAARLHQSGVPFDAEIADGPKGLRDAVALGSLRLSAEGAVQVEARLVGAGPPASASSSAAGGLFSLECFRGGRGCGSTSSSSSLEAGGGGWGGVFVVLFFGGFVFLRIFDVNFPKFQYH